jgi:hypothetical protein
MQKIALNFMIKLLNDEYQHKMGIVEKFPHAMNICCLLDFISFVPVNFEKFELFSIYVLTVSIDV